MPFTGSHPAAVLPLLGLGLVPSALIIGSMTPDLPYYLPVHLNSATTHSFLGILGVDLILGGLAFVLWQFLIAPLAVAAASPSVRGRLAPGLPTPWRQQVSSPRAVLLIVVSLWIGAATHVLWDEFTHAGRWGYRHLRWLAAQHGLLPGYRWAQYGSGVIGAVLIAFSIWRWWCSTPPVDPRHEQQPRLGRTTAAGVWTVIALAGLAGAATGWASAMLRGLGLARALFLTATWGGGAGLVAVLAWSLYRPTAYPTAYPTAE
jgi:Domain of unknown function (DUF4184)